MASRGGTSPDEYAFQAALASSAPAAARLQSLASIASKLSSAADEMSSSSAGTGPSSASVGTARAIASTSGPSRVRNSPYPGANTLSL